MPGLFIAGTDTGVGKTIITAGLAVFFKRQGLDCAVMKPLESGSLSGSPDSDSAYLKKMAESSDDLDLINTYAFQAPLAPGLAARLEGVEIFLDRILENYHRLQLLHRYALVEGAGGLLAPIGPKQTTVDLIQALGLPVLLVARDALGTINHSLLSLEYLRQRKIKVVGVVLNCTTKNPDPSQAYNMALLQEWTSVPIWGSLPHLAKIKDREELYQKISETIGPEALLSLQEGR